MEIHGIVCEYNPFHTGHLYHINECKRRGADRIVCVMSGNYVQRADFAMLDMHSRAETAIRNGADLVIQLPTPWVLSSAEKFAFGAVYILNALGSVTHLSYGAETEDAALHIKAAKLLLSPEFSEALKDRLNTGISFAAARESAVSQFDAELAKLLKKPNNILAVEYIKSLSELNSDIIPVAIKRVGGEHGDLATSHEYLSASAIRHNLETGNADKVLSFLPRETQEIIQREIKQGRGPILLKNADAAIMACLKRLKPSDFIGLSDVSEGLEIRLGNSVVRTTTFYDAVMLAKTKRYAHSRLRRIYLSAFIGSTSELSAHPPSYIRILAFNNNGRGLLSEIRRRAALPIVTKPALVKKLGEDAVRLFEFESRATDIYSLFRPVPLPGGSEWTTGPVYVDK